MKTVEFCSRPPREVVNWKICTRSRDLNGIVDLLGRSWIERWYRHRRPRMKRVDLLGRSWIESGGTRWQCTHDGVDLLGRSWIERWQQTARERWWSVDLLGRSWIERIIMLLQKINQQVDLLGRSWIERIPVRWRIWAACCRPSRKVWNWNGLLFVSIFKSSDVTSREGRVSRNYIPQCLY